MKTEVLAQYVYHVKKSRFLGFLDLVFFIGCGVIRLCKAEFL